MSNATLSQPGRTRVPGASPMPLLVGAVLAVWLAVVVALGVRGLFTTAPGTPPLPILLGVVAPLLVFLAAWRTSAAFRAYVLAADLRFIVAVQGWRAAGFAFLALWAHGILPGMFAWPAGLGDMAIGFTAPWVLAALLRRPGFAASRAFAAWNLFGMLDLIVAVSLGGLSAFLATGAAGEITTRPMALMPLILVPAYLVPLFLMLEITALLQCSSKPAHDASLA